MPDGDHDFGTDLVGYWPLDEATGTTAPDHSGNGNAGTLTNGPAWAAGKVANALDFDGVNDHTSVSDDDSLDIISNELTISAWVFPHSLSTNEIGLIGKEDYSSPSCGGQYTFSSATVISP